MLMKKDTKMKSSFARLGWSHDFGYQLPQNGKVKAYTYLNPNLII